MVKYSPPPEAEGGGLYLTVYPESSPNMGSISLKGIIMLMISRKSHLQLPHILPRDYTGSSEYGMTVFWEIHLAQR